MNNLLELVDIEIFVNDILPELPNCPVPAIERRLRDAVIEACERAPLWRYQLPEIPVKIGQTCFDLPKPPGETRIHDVIRLFMDRHAVENIPLEDTNDNAYLPIPNRGTGFHVLNRGQVGLNCEPQRDSDPIDNPPDPRSIVGLEVYVSLKPERKANQIAKIFYDDYYQLVIDGTLGYALDMRDTEWYDGEKAMMRRQAFEYELAKAKQSLDQGFSDRPLRIRPRRF